MPNLQTKLFLSFLAVAPACLDDQSGAKLPSLPNAVARQPKVKPPCDLDFVNHIKGANHFKLVVAPRNPIGCLVSIPQMHDGDVGPESGVMEVIIPEGVIGKRLDPLTDQLHSQLRIVRPSLLSLRTALPPSRFSVVLAEGFTKESKESDLTAAIPERARLFAGLLKDDSFRDYFLKMLKANRGAWDELPDRELVRKCESWRARLERIITNSRRPNADTELLLTNLFGEISYNTNYKYMLSHYGLKITAGDDAIRNIAHGRALNASNALVRAFGPLIMEFREDFVVEQAADIIHDGKFGDVLATVYGGLHSLIDNTERWNAKNPTRPLALVEVRRRRN